MTRTETVFNVLDSDKDGVVTIIDLVLDTKKYTHLNSDPNIIERCRLAMCEFAAELGIKPGVSVNKEEYVHNCATLAPKEVAKVRSGEGSVKHKLNNAVFDVIDTNHDGTVSKEEYRAFANATGVWDPNYVDVVFDLIDTNKNGKLERKEFSDYEYKLFFTLEDVAGKGQVEGSIKATKA